MRALVKSGKGTNMTNIQDLPIPKPGVDEALIQVKYTGVCGSDLHIYHDQIEHITPIILGHEFSGTVRDVGADVTNVNIGDNVVSENNPRACGHCPACKDGYPNVCPEKKAIGFKLDGCFAEYVKIQASLLHKVPDKVSMKTAALSEPLAVCVHAVQDRCGITKGDSVLVFGPGTVGLLCAQVARAEGAGKIIVVGTDKDVDLRLACAKKMGFEVCNVQKEDLSEKILSYTNGYGVDIVIEASGAKSAVNSGIELVRRSGKMLVLGITNTKSVTVDWNLLVSKAVSLIFSYSSRKRNWIKAMEYLAEDEIDLNSLISECLPLEKWSEAFEHIEKMSSLKSVLCL